MKINQTSGTSQSPSDGTVTYAGVALRRRTKTGPRGGVNHIYQAVESSPTWGYWYDSAKQAAKLSNSCDKVIRL